jgi:hypothetical protein
MIGPIVAAFFAGVFATLIVIFALDDREKPETARAPRPWQTITNAEGSTEITGAIKPGPMGALCAELLRIASLSKHLTTGPAMNQQVEGNRYRVFVSWRMVFTVDPNAPDATTTRAPPKTPRPAPPSMVKRG